VTLSYLEHEVALDVRDDGAGFDPARLGDDGAGNGIGAGPAGSGPRPGTSEPAYAGASGGPGAGGNGLPDGYGGQRRVDAGGGGGFGLVAMRQRIEGLSGTLQVESEPGAGTAISARIPVPAGASA
jgi:signal transduction histidine kinase